jgi:hypothetical protein
MEQKTMVFNPMQELTMFRCFKIMVTCLVVIGVARMGEAGSPLEKCSTPFSQITCNTQPKSSDPACGIEFTCTDKPILLGYSQGVCFRATCPGVWALLHTRLDQASFRRRLFSYRHYQFRGNWELKDQGTIEAGPATVRELFLVLQDDLIELKLADPDPYAKIEVKNLGYIKKGSVAELQQWLAYQTYIENLEANRQQSSESQHQAATDPRSLPNWCGPQGFLSGAFSLGRTLGLPLCTP